MFRFLFFPSWRQLQQSYSSLICQLQLPCSPESGFPWLFHRKYIISTSWDIILKSSLYISWSIFTMFIYLHIQYYTFIFNEKQDPTHSQCFLEDEALSLKKCFEFVKAESWELFNIYLVVWHFEGLQRRTSRWNLRSEIQPTLCLSLTREVSIRNS